jgi:DNA gyrase subunit A
LALVGQQPATLGLKELLLLFIQFRKKTLRRRLQFELNDSIEKNHLIKGLILTLNSIEFILKIVRSSKNNTEAKIILMEAGLTQNQSDAILNIQLRRLTRLESDKLKIEYENLNKTIKNLKKPLALTKELNEYIKKDISGISGLFGMPRRTNIIHSETGGSINEIEMIDNHPTIIMVTKFFIKRMVVETFEPQTRGTRGKKGVVIQENDEISHFFSCNTHDTILCISQNGIAFAFRAYQIPISRRTARGVSLSTVLPNISVGKISSIIPVSAFSKKEYLILLTRNGMIKKTPLIAFKNVTARGLTILKVGKDDELCWVRKCSLEDSILISTKNGKALRFLTNEKQLRATGRNSKGVRSISIENSDKIIDMDVLPISKIREQECFILAITKNGFGKKIISSDFRIQNRGGKGVTVMKLQQKNKDELLSLRFCLGKQEILMSSKNGTILRQKIEAIAIQKKNARGVILQKLNEGDWVSKVSLISENLEEFSQFSPD